MIKANQYIITGVSAEDADKLKRAINDPLNISIGGKIIIDFKEITVFSALFFNEVFVDYVLKLGVDEFKKQFTVQNLTNIGKQLYENSILNATTINDMKTQILTKPDLFEI